MFQLRLAVISVILMATLLTDWRIKRDQLRWEIVAIGSHEGIMWPLGRSLHKAARKKLRFKILFLSFFKVKRCNLHASNL